MKGHARTCLFLIAVSLFAIGASVLLAQGSSRGETRATIGSAHLSIEYGRPMLRGRDPLKMIKPGEVWRLGAGAPTTIDSDRDLIFGDTRVPKGKHILLAQMVEPAKWVLIVSSKAAAEYDPGAKIAEAPMRIENGEDSVEEMTIKLSGHQNEGEIEVAWGTSRLTANFSVAQ
ncbi:MAG TPA: DUF2911 domain-containing protein [Terriglobia bacterium]|nr:DUF2911 domain-containing protein [Terriglobia bacterium]